MSHPSIFNDVLGPVMRGPSSSHCAASLRIGRLCRDLMDGNIKDVLIEFDPNGSLATTHKSQGSDMGLFGGFLGWEAYDESLPNYQQAINEAGISIQLKIVDIGAEHPNTYKITLTNENESHQVVALSTGGGMIEVIEIDGAAVSMGGDYYETLIYTSSPEKAAAYVKATVDYDQITLCKGQRSYVEIKAQNFLTEAIKEELLTMEEITSIKELSPVLPIRARRNITVPFSTCDEMLKYNEGKNLSLWELAIHYESERGNISHGEVIKMMKEITAIMRNAVTNGLNGTTYKDRILGSQSLNFRDQMEKKALIDSQVLNTIIMYVSAIMETKSSMGVIVAAPTAGSCGAMPGTVLGASDVMKVSEEETVKAMLAAGMIGVFIAGHATFAAEVGGCQAECGSGSGMAAAALVSLAKGSLHQTLSAASMALQNSLGMICDPIANRVEAPCLGRNTLAAGNALSCANMALADYDHLIPLDQVIETMDEVGKSMHRNLRCTGLGGLAMTKASKAIEARLNELSPEHLELAQASQRFKIC